MVGRQWQAQVVGLIVLGVLGVVAASITVRVLTLYAADGNLTVEHIQTYVVILTSFLLVSVVVFWLLAIVLPRRLTARRWHRELRRIAQGNHPEYSADPLIAALGDTVQELETARRRLIASERLAAMGYFAGGLAHQIGNPLSAARQYMAAVLAGIQAGRPPDPEVLGRVEQQLDRIHRAIEGLSRFARPDRLESIRIRSADLLEQVATGVRAAGYPDVEIRLDVDASLEIETDPLALEQALVNFVRNGLEAQGSDVARVAIQLRHDQDATIITVLDHGHGFAPDFRPDTVLESEKLGGTGLGIPVAVRLVELLGGFVGFDNWESGGRVTIRFGL